MIITLTMNPSVDISYPIETLAVNSINRVKEVSKTAGGKGLNVARVIKIGLGSVFATGLLGGINGEYIKNELNKDGIEHGFLSITGDTRNCIAILHGGSQTEILEAGPTVNMQEQLEFKRYFTKLIKLSSIITLSGSLPEGIGNNYYAELIKIANMDSKKVLLDCSGESLKCVLKSDEKPYLIKPNHEELGYLIDEHIEPSNIELIAKVLKNNRLFDEIPIIVVSLGKNGAIAKFNNQIWRATIPKVEVKNPVGSGDSTLAGLAIGIYKEDPIDVLLKRAMTFGILNTIEHKTGFIDLSNYDLFFRKISVKLYQ